MFAETFAKDYNCIFAAEGLHVLTLEKIVYVVNCSWSNRSLNDDPTSLKIFLTMLSFCIPPSNQLD